MARCCRGCCDCTRLLLGSGAAAGVGSCLALALDLHLGRSLGHVGGSTLLRPGPTCRHHHCLCVPPAVDEAAGVVRNNPALTFQHPYPPTKVAFIPDKVRRRGRAD